ncbi:hypothetical protein CF326_g9094 [Tilletia indica]|nr:hypothetical protein CF326_g9094 [Tilletia indica]
MFVVINLKPVDNSPKPSTIILHPLLASEHLDDFSLPISFPVNAQAQLHVQDGQPVIYCQHRSCDVLQNGIPATKRPRRVYTGDSLQILSSDAPNTTSVTYIVQVAYLSFSSDLRVEVSVDLPRLQSAAALALGTETSSAFPLMLPLEGKLPIPAPTGTNWKGVRALVHSNDFSTHIGTPKRYLVWLDDFGTHPFIGDFPATFAVGFNLSIHFGTGTFSAFYRVDHRALDSGQALLYSITLSFVQHRCAHYCTGSHTRRLDGCSARLTGGRSDKLPTDRNMHCLAPRDRTGTAALKACRHRARSGGAAHPSFRTSTPSARRELAHRFIRSFGADAHIHTVWRHLHIVTCI